jgi:hypothetical protein
MNVATARICGLRCDYLYWGQRAASDDSWCRRL